MTKCSAEFSDSDPDKETLLMLERLGNSDELKQYRDTLLKQNYIKTNITYGGYHMQPVTYETVEKLFEYTTGNKISDYATNKNNEYSITTRAGGALQLGFGTIEGVSGMVIAPTCPSVVGCIASGVLITSGLDNASTGLSIVVDGKNYSTMGAKGLAHVLNISEADAELLYGLATTGLTTKAGQQILHSGMSTTGKLTANELDILVNKTNDFSKLTIDPHAGKIKLAEGYAAVDLQKLLGGKVKRIDDVNSQADFIFISGKNKGKTVDFMFTTANGTQKEIDGMNKFFNNNWDRNIEQLHDHINKADLIPLDFRKLNSANQERLENYINTLSESERSKLIIMR